MFLYGVQVTYVILPHVYFKLKKKKENLEMELVFKASA